MSKCCVNHYKLCAVTVCETGTIELPINAQFTGEYTFELFYLGSIIKDSEIFSTGEQIILTTKLNEDYAYTLCVYAPNKELVSFVIDGVEYNGFVFCTVPEIKNC
jgi:hypothetical protein